MQGEPTPPTPPTDAPSHQSSKLPWWQRRWGVVTIGVVCLLVGIGLGGASSSSNSKPPAPTPAQLAAQAEATKARIHQEEVEKATDERTRITNEKKEAREKAAVERAATRKRREEASERAREQQREKETAAHRRAEETKTYTGTGGENIGTINITVESTLYWECPPCGSDNFSITNNPNDENTIFVNTLNRTSGETHVDEGTYHDVQVNTEGESWTIRIAP